MWYGAQQAARGRDENIRVVEREVDAKNGGNMGGVNYFGFAAGILVENGGSWISFRALMFLFDACANIETCYRATFWDIT